MKELSLIYWAGFFDGEGCITVNGDGRMQISITQKGSEVLDIAKIQFGGNVYYKDKKYSDIYNWRLSKVSDVLRFLQSIYPYSIIKKEDIRLGIKLAKLNSTGRGQNGYEEIPFEELQGRMELRDALRKRKKDTIAYGSITKIKRHRQKIKEDCGFKCQVCKKDLKDTSNFDQIISDDKLFCRKCNGARYKHEVKPIAKEQIEQALRETNSLFDACKVLGINRSSLYKKRKKLGLDMRRNN
jgi:transposase-like protein